MDAAMSCFVFIVLPSREQLRAIAAEVWRVLRPGGRFTVLDSHPDHVGMRFSTGLLRPWKLQATPGIEHALIGAAVPSYVLADGAEWIYIVVTQRARQRCSEAK